MLLLDIYEDVLIGMKNVGPRLHGCGPPLKTLIQYTNNVIKYGSTIIFSINHMYVRIKENISNKNFAAQSFCSHMYIQAVLKPRMKWNRLGPVSIL